MLFSAASCTLSALTVAMRSTLVRVPVLMPLGPSIAATLVCVVVRRMMSRAFRLALLAAPRP